VSLGTGSPPPNVGASKLPTNWGGKIARALVPIVPNATKVLSDSINMTTSSESTALQLLLLKSLLLPTAVYGRINPDGLGRYGLSESKEISLKEMLAATADYVQNGEGKAAIANLQKFFTAGH